jgi:hypothetical protein
MFKRPDIPREQRLQALRVLGYADLATHDLVESFLCEEAAQDRVLDAASAAKATPPRRSKNRDSPRLAPATHRKAGSRAKRKSQKAA